VEVEGTVSAERVKVKEFCLEDICLTKQDLERIIEATTSGEIN
jgi:hypothetical protein